MINANQARRLSEKYLSDKIENEFEELKRKIDVEMSHSIKRGERYVKLRINNYLQQSVEKVSDLMKNKGFDCKIGLDWVPHSETIGLPMPNCERFLKIYW